MKKIATYLVFYTITSLLCIPLSGQQKRSSGTAQIKVEDNMTKEEARKKAEELAKIDAIVNAFGQYVGQESNLTVQDGRSSFNIIGTTRVKGEWVRELSKTFEEESRNEKGTFGTIQTQWITCIIRGVVKEATPKANIEFYTLNYPDFVSKANSFISGNRFYLWFRSPVDGYLSIFLDDGTDVFRLLPYDDTPSLSTVKIDADKEYIFFSKDHNNFENTADELLLYTSKNQELNTLHIIFSEKQYFKPVLDSNYKDENEKTVPKSLSKAAFEKWLAGNKTNIFDFLDEQVYIEIIREK
jgi:hypothetical protein